MEKRSNSLISGFDDAGANVDDGAREERSGEMRHVVDRSDDFTRHPRIHLSRDEILKLPILRIELTEVTDEAAHGYAHVRRRVPHGTRNLHDAIREGSARTMRATKCVEERHETVVFLKMLKTS